MLDQLLLLTKEDRNKILKRIQLESKRRIFENIPTMTEELGLDKIPDYETRVKMRYDLIQKFPDIVFWDYAECQSGFKYLNLPRVKVSINGDFVIFTTTNKLHITPLKTTGKNNYQLFRVPGQSTTKHRIIASTFLPKSERLKHKEIVSLQVNHIDGIKYNNRLTNLEWVTNQENQKHHHSYENYKVQDYFKFKVIIDNGFKGREFIIPENELNSLKVKANSIRNKINGIIKNVFWGMVVSQVNIETLCGVEIGLPADIANLFYLNSNYFDVRCKPVIGTVIKGKHSGLEFSLFGCKEIEKYFNRSHVHRTARGERKSHMGCSFRFSSHKEAIPLHGKLTEEIFNEVVK